MKTLAQAWHEHGVDEYMPPHDFFVAGWCAGIEASGGELAEVQASPVVVGIDVSLHKSNLREAIDRALKSRAKLIVLVGLDQWLVQQAHDAGREVVVLPSGSPFPEGTLAIPFFPGTERSRAFVLAQEMIAAKKGEGNG